MRTISTRSPRRIYRFRRLDHKVANLLVALGVVNKCLLGSLGRLKSELSNERLVMRTWTEGKKEGIGERGGDVRGPCNRLPKAVSPKATTAVSIWG